MSLIKPVNDEFFQRRYRLSKSLLDEVNSYCSWAKIKSENQFIESALSYVLKKDKEWQKIKLEYDKENSSSMS